MSVSAAMAAPHMDHSRGVASAPFMPITGAEALPPTHEESDGPRPRLSKRVRETEPAHIEAVLSRYAGINPPPANLAQGVAHWDPPPAAMDQIMRRGKGAGALTESACHRYGPALGLPALREALLDKLQRENELDMADQEVCAFVFARLCRRYSGTKQRCKKLARWIAREKLLLLQRIM